MRTLIFATTVLCFTVSARESFAQTKPTKKPPEKRPAVLHRFALNPLHVNIGTVAAIRPDGRMDVKQIANPRFLLNRRAAGKTDLTEGRYLGFVGREFVESTKDMRLVSLRVVEVKPGNTAAVQVSADAARRIKPGESILFFRPPGSTTAQLKSVPGYVQVDDGEKTTILGRASFNSARNLSASRNNLKQIALAMHNFHDVHKSFPPAVVYGPDGKPWHSWRVLILPYIDAKHVYDLYRFDEPWDGPNNRKLLKSMPDVYRDPVHGPQDGNYFTHYAAVTGKGTVFENGIRMKDKTENALANLTGDTGLRFRDITDGTSNTILVGPVGPERKIPWMKPDDVVFSDKFPPLGKKGSFAVPYKSGSSAFGPFSFADGSVQSLRADIDMRTLRNLLQKADGNPVGEFGGRQRPRGRAAPRRMQAVEILRSGGKTTARLVGDASD